MGKLFTSNDTLKIVLTCMPAVYAAKAFTIIYVNKGAADFCTEQKKINMAEIEKLRDQLDRIEAKLTAQKNVLNLDEAATFLGISKSHLYKLTSTGGIPCYSPGGKKIYFNRNELEAWALEGNEGLNN